MSYQNQPKLKSISIMNATATPGIWVIQLTDTVDMIVDTNRNQIIKRAKGVASLIQFATEPTLDQIKGYASVFKRSANIVETCENAIARYKALRQTNKITQILINAIKQHAFVNGVNVILIDHELTPNQLLLGEMNIELNIETSTLYSIDHIVDEYFNVDVISIEHDLQVWDKDGDVVKSVNIDENEIVEYIQ